jgi:hypothetical protein
MDIENPGKVYQYYPADYAVRLIDVVVRKYPSRSRIISGGLPNDALIDLKCFVPASHGALIGIKNTSAISIDPLNPPWP